MAPAGKVAGNLACGHRAATARRMDTLDAHRVAPREMRRRRFTRFTRFTRAARNPGIRAVNLVNLMNLVNLYASILRRRNAAAPGRGVRLAYLAQLPRSSGAFEQSQRRLTMYRFDMPRLTFFCAVNVPGKPPEIGEDAGNMRHPANVWTASCMAEWSQY